MVCNVNFDFVKQQPVLKNAPLTLVICQVRFPRQVGLGEGDVRPIQSAIADRYPVVQVGRSANLVLGPAGVAPVSEAEPIFHFCSEDEAWTLTLTPSSASLETNAYLDFSDFLSRWVETVGVVLDVLRVRRQDRIGLRYVNELPCPLRPSPEQLAELVHGLVARSETDGRYVLDFDSYDDTAQPLNVEMQQRLLADFNHRTYSLFRWSVPTDRFMTFEPEEVQDA
jgi:hypothetical protein